MVPKISPGWLGESSGVPLGAFGVLLGGSWGALQLSLNDFGALSAVPGAILRMTLGEGAKHAFIPQSFPSVND